MKILLQTLFFFLLVTQISFAQWYQQNSGTTANLNSVHFEDANNGWAVGDSGIILHTTNGGQEWIAQTSGTDRWLQSVSFTDLNYGTTVGGGENDTTEEGIILSTTNGGMIWFQQTSGSTHNLAGVSFVDSNNGWAVGKYKSIYPGRYFGTILHTTDGGTTWAEQLSDTLFERAWLRSVSFTDANNGTAVGGGGWLPISGTILRTTNGGTNWIMQAGYLTKLPLFGVSFTDANNGTVVGLKIYRTTDRGTTWPEQSSGVGDFLYGVSFTDANNGTAVGANGTILRTTNGGTTWISQTSGTTTILRSVSFIDANNGWAVGNNGTILHTINGGNPVPVELTSFTATANGKEVTLGWTTATEMNNQGFEVQRKFGSNDFVTVGSVKGHGTTTSPNNYTYVDKLTDAGKYFYRLKQIDFGGKYEYSQTVEINWSPFTTYKLEQNYPNPFNPTTTIGFGISEKGNVRLSVHNILGEEIRNLLNEEKEPGYHSVEFDASELPSSVYFYRIQSGNFIDTKKMLLLK